MNDSDERHTPYDQAIDLVGEEPLPVSHDIEETAPNGGAEDAPGGNSGEEAPLPDQPESDKGAEEDDSAPKKPAKDWVSIIRESPFTIRQVPKRKQTDEMVLAAIIEGESEFRLPNGEVVTSSTRPLLNDKGIAKARINGHVLNELLKANPWRIGEVPEKKLNRSLVRTAVEHSAGHPEVLSLVPERFRTRPICTLAVEEDPRALQYVPDDFKTRKLCKSAVERDESVIQWVPKGYIDAKTRRRAEKSLKALREAEEAAKAKEEAAKAKAEEEAAALKAKEERAKEAVADVKEDVASHLAPAAEETAPTPAADADRPAPAPTRRVNPLTRHFHLLHRG